MVTNAHGTSRLNQAAHSGRWTATIRKAANLFTSFLIAFLVTTSLAQAAVESVPLVTLWCDRYITGCIYTTDTAAGQAEVASYNKLYAATNPFNDSLFFVSCNGSGICIYGFRSTQRTMILGPLGMANTVACPVPKVNPTIQYQYNPATLMCERTVQDCPVHSSGTYPDACVCDTGYKVDPAGTSCVPVSDCPVKPLKDLPANDACAQALESTHTTQAQKYAACGALSSAMQTGKSCLAGKLSGLATPIPLAVTADIRNLAYQAHFREIWDKMEDLVDLEGDPVKRTACAARRAEIAAEKGCDNRGPCVEKAATASAPSVPACYPTSASRRSHCLKGMPARPDPNGAQHAQGNAIDVSEDNTINPLKAALAGLNPPQKIQQFLDAPTNCNLIWGGDFKKNIDNVHFHVR